jgi:hypothetical protein
MVPAYAGATVLSCTFRNSSVPLGIDSYRTNDGGVHRMGRYLLLWLLGVPIPILVLIYAFGGLN